MPTFNIAFRKNLVAIFVVEAESVEAAYAAAACTLEFDGIDEDAFEQEDWSLDSVVETHDPADYGIGGDSTFVSLANAVPPEDRLKFECPHGNDVDMYGAGCSECGEQSHV